MRDTRVRAIRSWASLRSSGGKASALSLMTSTAVPPRPNTMTGPKVGSSAIPAISSRALGRKIMGWMVTPVMRACGICSRARARISATASRTAGCGGQVQPHAADLRLVHDVGRQDLGDHGRAVREQRRGDGRGLVGVARQQGGRDRNRIGGEAGAWPRSGRATVSPAASAPSMTARAAATSGEKSAGRLGGVAIKASSASR